MGTFTKRELFYYQQLLVEAFPNEYDVLVYEGYLSVTTLTEPRKSKYFKTIEEVEAFLNAPITPELQVKLTCWDMELDRIKGKVFPLFKFKRNGKYYQRPGAELKVWFFPTVKEQLGAPLPAKDVKVGYGKVTDMYGNNGSVFHTADELIELLSSSKYR